MFDIGFPEFFLAALIALLVLGPERLPGALRTLGLWVGRLRRSYYQVKTEIEREIGMDEVRRQLHNEQVMADVRRVEREVQAMGEDMAGREQPSIEGATTDLPNGTSAAAVQPRATDAGSDSAGNPSAMTKDPDASGREPT